MARKLKKKVKIFLFTFLVILPITILGVFIFGTPEAPEEELTRARVAIAEANKIIEKDFIPTSLTDAKNLYDSAMFYWKIENERFILSRNYSKTRTFAIRAEQQALVSPKIALQNTNDFLSNLEKDFATVRRDTATIGQLVRKLPVPANINKKYTRGLMHLQEALLNKEQKNYKECNVKLAVAKSDLADVAKYTKSLVDGYFTRLPMWKRWADQTINESAQTKSYAIVVDKFAGKCFVYKAGQLKTTFNVELGKNWIGDKMYSGDKATPEGKYKVTKKKDGAQTKYFKALLLNYPNDEDKKRFQNGIKQRTIPGYARIGGLIEIHGGGGKGINWTDGCIAFSNNDMETLYRMIPVGCPVTILGSLQPIHEVLNMTNP